MDVTRREFCWSAVATTVAAGCTGGAREGTSPGPSQDASPSAASPQPPAEEVPQAGGERAGPPPEQMPPAPNQPGFSFWHGVASGDPLRDRVVLWTRVTPDEDAPLSVDWVIARDRGLRDLIARGRARTDATRDYTVKVDVTDLAAGQVYYYAFEDPAKAGWRSPLGRTRTLPEGAVERARLAVCSCSCYAIGYFNSYAHIAAQEDLDAVVHLGDYIYEYGSDTYYNPDLDRRHAPDAETVTLADYRTRYAQYREDPDLQEAHRQHPFIAVWDDHEVANNAWSTGADNHTAEEGSYEARKAAASQAYREWMPIRERTAEGELALYRRFTYGDLLDLLMLDTRHLARARPGEGVTGHALLGEAQERWLHDTLRTSQSAGVRWRALGQQVMMAQLELAGSPLNRDQWDGYPADRARLFDVLERDGVTNVVVLTGDIHSSWANELARDPFGDSYDRESGAGALAVEAVVSSVTSPAVAGLAGAAASSVLRLTHPHVRWHDLERRGYVLLDVTPARVQADWYHADTVAVPDATHRVARSYQALDGRPRWIERAEPTGPRDGAPAPA